METEKIREGFSEYCLLRDDGPIIIGTLNQHLIHPFSYINDIHTGPFLLYNNSEVIYTKTNSNDYTILIIQEFFLP